MGNSFICADCKEEFDYVWSDEEAEAEAKENFGGNVMETPTSVVCDDCYKSFMKELLN